MAHDRSGIATTDTDRRQGRMAGRPGHVRAVALSAPVAALLLMLLLAVGAVDFLRRDERADQAAPTIQGGPVADGEREAPGTDGRGADATTRPERQLGAAAGALAALLVAAAALVVMLFAVAGLAVLLFAAALWAALRRRPVTRR